MKHAKEQYPGRTYPTIIVRFVERELLIIRSDGNHLESDIARFEITCCGNPTLPNISPYVRREFEKENRRFIFDLTSVEYFDARGIAWLINCVKQIEQLRGDAVLVNLCDRMSELLRVTKFNEMFHIRDSLEDGFRYLDEAGVRPRI